MTGVASGNGEFQLCSPCSAHVFHTGLGAVWFWTSLLQSPVVHRFQDHQRPRRGPRIPLLSCHPQYSVPHHVPALKAIRNSGPPFPHQETNAGSPYTLVPKPNARARAHRNIRTLTRLRTACQTPRPLHTRRQRTSRAPGNTLPPVHPPSHLARVDIRPQDPRAHRASTLRWRYLCQTFIGQRSMMSRTLPKRRWPPLLPRGAALAPRASAL